MAKVLLKVMIKYTSECVFHVSNVGGCAYTVLPMGPHFSFLAVPYPGVCCLSLG